ncbi:MAG: ribosome biogenesis factor YjgA [Betaproteobacteria bacterium]
MTPAYRRPPGRNDLPTGSDADAGKPSKTRLKREMDALQELGETLVGLAPKRLAMLALPERLVDAIALAREITKHEARRRQIQYVGRLMRDVDPAPIRATLAGWETMPRAEKARIAAFERWRDRLLVDAGAIDAFVAEHPAADRDAIVHAVSLAQAEQLRGGPPHAFRALFRILRRAAVDADPPPA